jgi:rhodanese-related sulfurtransferase
MDDALLNQILHTPQLWVAAGALGVAIWGAWYAWRRDRWKGRILTPGQVQELVQAGDDPLMWDSRKPAKRKSDPFTVDGALVLPVEQIPERLRAKASAAKFQELRTAEIIVFDDTIDRATLAAKFLQAHGMTNVALMAGGVKAWREAGLPLQALTEEDDDK